MVVLEIPYPFHPLDPESEAPEEMPTTCPTLLLPLKHESKSIY